MKLIILVIFCSISLHVSAQFWKDPFWKKKKPQLPCVELLPEISQGQLVIFATSVTMPDVNMEALELNTEDINDATEAILKEAKHNMRFRVYDAASYNFTQLAGLYFRQNRFSEAKWYFLQSNNISREQGNDKHTIANLIGLAAIKLAIGENALAKSDLLEAQRIAAADCFADDIALVEKKLYNLQFAKPIPKAELRYADGVEIAAKP